MLVVSASVGTASAPSDAVGHLPRRPYRRLHSRRTGSVTGSAVKWLVDWTMKGAWRHQHLDDCMRWLRLFNRRGTLTVWPYYSHSSGYIFDAIDNYLGPEVVRKTVYVRAENGETVAETSD